jgi:hypothetical protein
LTLSLEDFSASYKRWIQVFPFRHLLDLLIDLCSFFSSSCSHQVPQLLFILFPSLSKTAVFFLLPLCVKPMRPALGPSNMLTPSNFVVVSPVVYLNW